jgi:hypothetical protein
MATIAERISKRLTTLRESVADTSWKDPHSGNYDRQKAEDALFHTIGPLTEFPRWASRWSSPSDPVPGFTPGGPAPRWTQEEVIYAFAGDPRLMFHAGSKNHPLSPTYGTRGGAPLFRLARKVARQFKRERDQSFIEELYQNGFVELTRLMKPGYDKGQAGFISFVITNVEGAMVNGTSATGEAEIKARGDVAKDSGLIGLNGLFKAKTPEDARKVAAQIKGKYQGDGEHKHDKHDDNPFGAYSHRIFALANNYAQALESGDKEVIDRVRSAIEDTIDEIDAAKDTMVLGAGTGIGQAVTNHDRKTKIGINSMDMPTGDGTGSIGDTIGAPTDEVGAEHGEMSEAITFVLNIALEHDLQEVLGNDPKAMEMAAQFGLKPGEKLGGRMTAAEYRCVLRKLGPVVANYPGKGQMRTNVQIPRDMKGWWEPGEDPEIEPIPSGGTWRSIWTRGGYMPMENAEIGREFTEEYKEFAKLGIQGVKARMDAAALGKEVLSKVSIGHAVNSAMIKVKLLGQMYRSKLGMGESKMRAAGMPILEDYDPLDRRLVMEAIDYIVRTLTRSIVLESRFPSSKREVAMEDAALGITWTR